MEIEINYRVKRIIEADTLEEAVKKWEECDLNDGQGEFVEVQSVFNANTFEELTSEFDELY